MQRDIRVLEIAMALSIEAEPAAGMGDLLWPILERIKLGGAVVVVELDGERTTRQYTALVSAQPLSGDFCRADTSSLREAVGEVISQYAERVWGI